MSQPHQLQEFTVNFASSKTHAVEGENINQNSSSFKLLSTRMNTRDKV